MALTLPLPNTGTLTNLSVYSAYTSDGTNYQDSARTTPVTANAQLVGSFSDLSANGRHLPQATAGNRPTYITDVAPEWAGPAIPGILINANNIAFDLFSSASIPSQGFCVVASIMATTAQISSRVLVGFSAPAVFNLYFLNQAVTIFDVSNKPTVGNIQATAPTCPITVAFNSGTSAVDMSLQAVLEQLSQTTLPITSNTMTAAKIGNLPAGTAPLKGSIIRMCILPDRVATAPELAAMKAWCNEPCLQDPLDGQKIVPILSNSIGAGVSSDTYQHAVFPLMFDYANLDKTGNNKLYYRNLSIPGINDQTILTNIQAGQIPSSWVPYIAAWIVWELTNDMNSTQNATTVYNRHVAIVSAVRAIKNVPVFTGDMLPRGVNATIAAQRLLLNGLLKSGVSATGGEAGNYIFRWGSSSSLQTATDVSVIFTDQIHPIATGMAIMSSFAAPVMSNWFSGGGTGGGYLYTEGAILMSDTQDLPGGTCNAMMVVSPTYDLPVTIYYQDSTGTERYISAKPGMVVPVGAKRILNKGGIIVVPLYTA